MFLFSLKVYDRLLITSWGHDPGVVPTSNVLTMLNDALTHSAVLIQVISWGRFFFWATLAQLCVMETIRLCVCVTPQGHGMHGHGEMVHIPFPFDEEDLKGGK